MRATSLARLAALRSARPTPIENSSGLIFLSFDFMDFDQPVGEWNPNYRTQTTDRRLADKSS